MEGAKAIVEGRIGELNVSSQQSEKCYIHNNIFYTFCVEEPLGLSQLRGEEAPSTSIMASVDMDNMKLLEAIDGKDVHTVQTALIRYRGFVVTAQSLIQGILYYEETTWTKYGSINDGKTIVAEDDFKKAVKEISAIFHAKDDLAFKDKEEKIHQLTSSVDVKGIKAGDGRKYILDLFRMSPRDLNWEGQEFDALVFRPKLVESFIYQQKLDLSDAIRTRFTAKLSEVKKKQQDILMKIAVERDAIKKAESTEEGEEITPKEEVSKELTDELNKLRVEAQEVHSQMGKEIEEEIKRLNLNDLRFDTSLYSGMESYYENKSQEEAEREKLRKLAEFARGKMVNNFIEEWSRMAKTFPIDTISLVQAMHNYGLSSRYLGYILKALDVNTHMKHTLLTQRTIIVRSLSHIFNQVLTSVPYLQLSDTLSHLLNCVLGTEEIQDFLGQKVKNLSNYNAEDADLDGGKKKKKKKQKKVQQVKCDLEPNKYMLYTPSDLFGEMNKISEVRYKHKFVDQKSFCNFIFLRSNTDRMSMLRELSLSIGMCLGFRDFNFAGKNSSGSLELPIKPSDIGQFIPKVKKIEVEFLHTKANYALGAQCIASGKYEQAVDIFNSNLQALLNVTPI